MKRFPTEQAHKGRAIGMIAGIAIGFGVSFLIWGPCMFDWGVPSGLPILFCAFVGAFLGQGLLVEKGEAADTQEEFLSLVLKGGVKGLVVGSLIGACLGGLLAVLARYSHPSMGMGFLSMIILFGISAGGLLGFLSDASTSYRRPEK